MYPSIASDSLDTLFKSVRPPDFDDVVYTFANLMLAQYSNFEMVEHAHDLSNLVIPIGSFVVIDPMLNT